jgi:hypothetical protein
MEGAMAISTTPAADIDAKAIICFVFSSQAVMEK